MSTQSVRELSQHRYARENEKTLLAMSDAYFQNKNFLLGAGVDSDRLQHAMLFNSFLCQSNCEIVNFIEDKIAGRLEDCGFPVKKKKLKHLLKQCEEGLSCNNQEALNYVIWANPEW